MCFVRIGDLTKNPNKQVPKKRLTMKEKVALLNEFINKTGLGKTLEWLDEYANPNLFIDSFTEHKKYLKDKL